MSEMVREAARRGSLILFGIGNVLNIGGLPVIAPPAVSSPADDFRKDFAAVGQDLRQAMGDWSRDRGPASANAEQLSLPLPKA